MEKSKVFHEMHKTSVKCILVLGNAHFTTKKDTFTTNPKPLLTIAIFLKC